MSLPALLLVDLQEDYFARPGLHPDRSTLIAEVRRLLDAFRAAGLPVAHVRTAVEPAGTDAMPHWQSQPICVTGTAGAAAPAGLQEQASEYVALKQFYRGFADAGLDPWLRGHGVDTVVIAGLYTHACVRDTALDAYERGFSVIIAADAVGSNRPEHAADTLDWIAARAARVQHSSEILAELADLPAPPPSIDVELIAERVAGAQRQWQLTATVARRQLLHDWADAIEQRQEEFVQLIVREVRKPIRLAQDEVNRTVAHIRTAAQQPDPVVHGSAVIADRVRVRPAPLGVIGIIMPWNNPLSLPVGKIAPALMCGNGVLLKPAPESLRVAELILDAVRAVGLPDDLVQLVPGGPAIGQRVVQAPAVTGVAVTGSIRTGRAIAHRCVELGKPIQAELGGNNAAIVLADVDLPAIVPPLAINAFGYAGQRCTAIRRFVVEDSVIDAFIEQLRAELPRLAPGEPTHPGTVVGPLISAAAAQRVERLIAHAVQSGCELLAGGRSFTRGGDHFVEPTVLLCRDPEHPIVQQESFGPIAVIQPASDLAEAITLANGVPQGLVMAVCTRDPEAASEIARQAQVGILSFGAEPVPVHPDAPFGGWKASGFGTPEHGIWDAQFFTRPQAIYGEPG